ncbi:MAG: DUF4290 domain-containing protein [Bacteroidetes bacterium]|nr:DUF4290 domain-containing protein [Bacteroidota bacterium]
MDYNSQRPKMTISEYGRGIQQMVAHIKTLPTKEERIKAAHATINAMLVLNPQLRELSDSKQTLWDHIYIMAGYELDIDSPFPIPEPLEKMGPPIKPSYNNHRIKYRYYGRYSGSMIQKALEMEAGERKDAFLNTLGSYMKMAFRVWNDDKAPDSLVIQHIRELSGGEIELKEIAEMASHNENFQTRTSKNNQRNNKNRNNRTGGGNNNNRNNRNTNKKYYKR